MISVFLQWLGGPPPSRSAVRAYAPLLSALLPQKFDPPLQPSNVSAPLSQISALPLQPLALNPPPLTSVLFQGRCRLLLLTSFAYSRAPLLPASHLQQGMPLILRSKVPGPIARISALHLQQGGPRFQTSSVNHPPPISALLIQRSMLPLQP